MKAIVAADRNWGIGNKGKLLTHIPNDLKYFKEKTLNKVVVMGRKTFESLPGGQPLINRHNIILSRNKDYCVKGAVVLHSKKEVLDYVKDMKSDDIYICGGEYIYNLFFEDINEIFVTRIDYSFQSDTFFPSLDSLEEWEVCSKSEEQTYFNICYCWYDYIRKRGKDGLN